MPLELARLTLEASDPNEPFHNRLQFYQHLAAYARIYTEKLNARTRIMVRPGEYRRARDLLVTWANTTNTEYLMNNVCVIQRIPIRWHSQLPSGTCSTETVCYRVNQTLDNLPTAHYEHVLHTLTAMHLRSLLSFSAVRSTPSIVHNRQCNYEMGTIAAVKFTDDDWKLHCRTEPILPNRQRKRATQQYLRENPPSKRPRRTSDHIRTPIRRVHRTPFELRRRPLTRQDSNHPGSSRDRK